METDISKRVYQGVRVKHTVKDLLAEKRSRQTNGPRYSVTTSQSSFVPMQGYYSMRRSFNSDMDFCLSGKQFCPDVYSSPIAGKTLTSDSTSMPTYSSFIDSYYPESFGDYRSPSFTSGGSSIFSPPTLSSLLPPFSGESSHVLLRDTWDPVGVETVTQADGLCAEGLMPTHVPSCLSSSEAGGASPCRSPQRGGGLPIQPYSLHPLDEVPYPTSYLQQPGFCGPYATASSDLTAKGPPLAPDEPTESDGSAWGKLDVSNGWPAYEGRRVL
ncbi:POU domain class 2-associating factor 2 [Denticeps clupeoides]|uniref:OCA domain-containing protein n=1 Tax=Denticeps clupeoides TaxID=299321 RepID=A0AAY4CUX7_9TELE|nr:uncharacterized protein C11orf53 homolog [Denticeps clupeoides]